MSNTKKRFLGPLGVSVSAAMLASSLSISAMATENPFATVELSNGFMLAEKGAEGKCGEGKCGEGKCGESKDAQSKDPEGKCGEGKCGEGKDAQSKDPEGKCGEGKCGGSKS